MKYKTSKLKVNSVTYQTRNHLKNSLRSMNTTKNFTNYTRNDLDLLLNIVKIK